MYDFTHAKGLHSAVFLACQYAGFIPKVSQYAIQVQTVLAPVDSGLGVALVPSVMRRHISDKIVCRPLPDVPPGASIGLALAYMAEQKVQPQLVFVIWRRARCSLQRAISKFPRRNSRPNPKRPNKAPVQRARRQFQHRRQGYFSSRRIGKAR